MENDQRYTGDIVQRRQLQTSYIWNLTDEQLIKELVRQGTAYSWNEDVVRKALSRILTLLTSKDGDTE